MTILRSVTSPRPSTNAARAGASLPGSGYGQREHELTRLVAVWEQGWRGADRMNRWQRIAVAALAAALFSGGWWTGTQRERSAWQAEKLAMSAGRDRQIDAVRQAKSRLRAQVRRRKKMQGNGKKR